MPTVIESLVHLVPNQLAWCDYASLIQLMAAGGMQDPTIGRALAYLTRKGIVTRVMVNLPPRDRIKPLATISMGTGLDRSEMAEQLRLLINVPTVPTEMIGATKLWAGVAGVRHRFPAGRCEWLAHMRLAVAIASVRDASRLPVPWYHQPPRGKTPKLLHAKLGTLMVVVPIHSNVKTLDHIVSRLTQWGGDYAIW